MMVASLAAFIGTLAVVQYVGVVCLLIFLTLWTAGAAAYCRAQAGLPGWLINGLALLAVAVTFLWTPGEDVLTDRFELMVILLGLKFSGTKASRDYLQIFLLVIFLLTGSAYLFADVTFILFLVALLLLSGVGAVLLSYLSEDRFLSLTLATSGKVCVSAVLISFLVIPLMAVLFVAMPRSGYPMLNFTGSKAGSITGFSDRIALGVMTNIQENNAVAFRAETGQKRIAEDMLYWRGIVFDSFDGKKWATTSAGNIDESTIRLKGIPVYYTVYLEPSNSDMIVTLDKPLSLPLRRMSGRPDLTYSVLEPVNNPLSYNAFSVPTEVIPTADLPPVVYLQLPAGLERIREKEQSLVPRNADAATAIRSLMLFLKSGAFHYAQSGLPISGKPLEEFLFTSRRGNCEYFASALAVMLRMAGVPARIVGGYRGGYFQETGGYYVVFQKNAHVWVEAYVPGTGWIRLDPTPVQSADFTSAARRGLRFWSGVKLDVLQYYFMIFVLNYDFQMQAKLFSLLAAAAGKPPAFLLRNRKQLAAMAAILTIISLSPFFYRRFRHWGGSHEERLLRVFLDRMEKMGYRKLPYLGLEEFIRSVEKKEIYEEAQAFVKAYQETLYHDRRLSRREAAILGRMVSQIGNRP